MKRMAGAAAAFAAAFLLQLFMWAASALPVPVSGGIRYAEPFLLHAYAAETGHAYVSYVIDDAPFRIYRVGHYDGVSTWVTDGEYADDPVDLTAPEAAATLEGYILRDRRESLARLYSRTGEADPAAAGQDISTSGAGTGTAGTASTAAGGNTGTAGTASTAAGGNTGTAGTGTDPSAAGSPAGSYSAALGSGIYLLLGEAVTVDGVTYTPKPTLFDMPHVTEDGSVIWDVTVSPKYQLVRPPEPHTYRVIVVWVNDTPKVRPKEVEVSLFESGQAAGSLHPEEAGGWRGSFDALTDIALWSVTESVLPEGYTTAIELVGDTFVITNTWHEKEKPSSPSSGGGSGGGGPGGGGGGGTYQPGTILRNGSDVPAAGNEEPESTISQGVLGANRTPQETQAGVLGVSRLPQTGQLFWPIPVLIFAGLFGLLLYCLVIKSPDFEEKGSSSEKMSLNSDMKGLDSEKKDPYSEMKGPDFEKYASCKRIFLSVSFLCFLLAAGLGVYNRADDLRAGRAAEQLLRKTLQNSNPGGYAGSLTDADGTGDPGDIGMAAETGGLSAFAEAPLYRRFPDMSMPVETVDGTGIVGKLSIPELSLELPIISEWSYPGLRQAPCRYQGSAYKDNLVIAAHNYDRHFGRIQTLDPGSLVCFTDMDGNRFSYRAGEIEYLRPEDVEGMTTGNWDLTLFTCTKGGKQRIALRCAAVGSDD